MERFSDDVGKIGDNMRQQEKQDGEIDRRKLELQEAQERLAQESKVNHCLITCEVKENVNSQMSLEITKTNLNIHDETLSKTGIMAAQLETIRPSDTMLPKGHDNVTGEKNIDSAATEILLIANKLNDKNSSKICHDRVIDNSENGNVSEYLITPAHLDKSARTKHNNTYLPEPNSVYMNSDGLNNSSHATSFKARQINGTATHSKKDISNE